MLRHRRPFLHLSYVFILTVSWSTLLHGQTPIDSSETSQSEDGETEHGPSIGLLLTKTFEDMTHAMDLLAENPNSAEVSSNILHYNAVWGCWLGSFCGGPCIGSLSVLLASLYGAHQTPEDESWVLLTLGSAPGLIVGLTSILYTVAASSLLGALNIQAGSDPMVSQQIYVLTAALSAFSIIFYIAAPLALYGVIFAENWRLKEEQDAWAEKLRIQKQNQMRASIAVGTYTPTQAMRF